MKILQDIIYSPAIVSLAIAFGASIGSFAALIIDRLPNDRSIVWLRSQCSGCAKKLRPWHNLPIISWLFLRGKCFFCGAPIGLRSLMIELFFAGVFLALVVKLGLSFALVEKFLLVFLLICLAYIDLDTYSLPYSLLLLLALLGAGSTWFYWLNADAFIAIKEQPFFLKYLVFNEFSFSIAKDRLLGSFLGWLFLSAINLIATPILRRTKRLSFEQWAMGWGDPLLLLGVGFFVGVSHLLLVIFLASLTGSICGLVLEIFAKKQESHGDLPTGALPFGPFISLAAIYVYVV